jgi:hypothetical protein
MGREEEKVSKHEGGSCRREDLKGRNLRIELFPFGVIMGDGAWNAPQMAILDGFAFYAPNVFCRRVEESPLKSCFNALK